MLDVPTDGKVEQGKIISIASNAGAKTDQVMLGVALASTTTTTSIPCRARGYVLELVVTVRTGAGAATGPDEDASSVDMQEVQNASTASKSTIIGGTSYSIGGFASPEAAVSAAQAMVEWCCTWSSSQKSSLAQHIDKGINTDGEGMSTDGGSNCTGAAWQPSKQSPWCSNDRLPCPDATVGASSSHNPEYYTQHGPCGSCSQTSYAIMIDKAPERDASMIDKPPERDDSHRLSSISVQSPALSAGCGGNMGHSMSGPSTVGVWSSEKDPSNPNNRLICHRDSLDLQSNHSGRSFNLARKSSKFSLQAAKSSIIGVFQSHHAHARGQDEASNGDPSDDDIDMRRWSSISEARETALLNKEPKSIFARHGRLPFRTFSTREAIMRVPKCMTGSSMAQNRSYTPPKSRSGEYAPSDSTARSGRSGDHRRSAECPPRPKNCLSPRARSPCSVHSLVSNTSSHSGSRPVMLGVLDMNGMNGMESD